MKQYEDLKRRLAAGWNTWNMRSVLSHVHLPEGIALNLGVKEYCYGQYLKEALIGRQEREAEVIRPGRRSYDGSYTQLEIAWQELDLRVESATAGDDLVLLVTLLQNPKPIPPKIVLEGGMLWNRPGVVMRQDDHLVIRAPGKDLSVYPSAPHVDDPYVYANVPYLAVPLEDKVGFSTGTRRTLEQIEAIVAHRRIEREGYLNTLGPLADVYQPMQTAVAWDTVYEPKKDRVLSPVSRLWCCWHGGYTLYCWDQYFAACMASVDNRDLAYANAIEITREAVKEGFVPNGVAGTGRVHSDRSEPCVGGITVEILYRRYREKWLVEMLFDQLLAWNRWWHRVRLGPDGLLAWGSTPFTPTTGNIWESNGVGDRWGASMESGLDNSPMYDDIPFDKERNILRLADAGLNGLYLADCLALAYLADEIGRTAEAAELRARYDQMRTTVAAKLWDEKTGMFLNRRSDTGEFSPRMSPTNFYPLLGQAATPAQAARAVNEHLLNPAEFDGEWVLPSIARNDPAFVQQDYWRGRIWAPMNFLAYLALRQYDLPAARRRLADKSRALLLKEWSEKGHIHENYNAITGEGCDKPTSDRFYHWGGLLGLISFFEAGWFDRAQA